jgi:hypothetical protein
MRKTLERIRAIGSYQGIALAMPHILRNQMPLQGLSRDIDHRRPVAGGIPTLSA